MRDAARRAAFSRASLPLKGVIMLAGIAVSNSILMVEFARHLRSEEGST